jgi:hypothetical protein
MFDHKHYVPIIRWKEAERLALKDLGHKEKAGVTPLIEITPRAVASEGTPSITEVDWRLSKVAKEILEHWGNAPIFLDLGLIEPGIRASGGTHPVIVLFEEGRTLLPPSFIPVTALDRKLAYQDAVKAVIARDRLGLCLRLRGSQIQLPGLSSEIDRLLTMFGLAYEDVDILVDYGIIDGVPLSFAETCMRLPNLSCWRTFTVASGAFPKNQLKQ